MLRISIAFLFCILVSQHAYPSNDKLQILSEHPIWQALLVINEDGHSDINSKAFFLSDHGNADPLAELAATIKRFDTFDVESICKFRGRLAWLSRVYYNDVKRFSHIPCKQYDQWSEFGRADISLVFASGYFKNPASYFGHILVKVGSDDLSYGLDQASINFGARIPPDENMLAYIFKGLFGQYVATYRSIDYFSSTTTYGEMDLRDMWEYRLKLSDSDRELMLGHIWEVLQEEYTYFFIDKNCVYRIAELFSVLGEHNFLETAKPWVTPQDYLQSMVDVTYDGQKLVTGIHYRPSRQSNLYGKYNQTDHREKRQIHMIVDDIVRLESEEFDVLPLNSKYLVLDTLLDYYQYREAIGKPDNVSYQRVLEKRYELPIAPSVSRGTPDSKPHAGRKSSYTYMRISSIDGQHGSNLFTIGMRPAYYDALDSGHGHVKNSTLIMGGVEVSSSNGREFIEKMDLVKVESLRINSTGLPGDRARSWSLTVGAEQSNASCIDCLAFLLSADTGYSKSYLSGAFVVSGFIGIGLKDTRLRQQSAFASASAGVIANMDFGISMRLKLSYQDFYNDSEKDTEDKRFEFRKALTKNSDLRLQYENNHGAKYGLGFGLYW